MAGDEPNDNEGKSTRHRTSGERRRPVRVGLVVAMVLAGVWAVAATTGALAAGPDGVGEQSGWTTDSSENGTATVDASGPTTRLNFSVYKCNYAFANRSLGDVDGNVSVSFDYRTYSDDYWELSTFRIYEDGREVFNTSESDEAGINNEEGPVTVTGSVSVTVPVDGETTLQFGIRPSQYCSNADHADTEFNVTNLEIEVVPDPTPTPTPSPTPTRSPTPSPSPTPTATRSASPSSTTPTSTSMAATPTDDGTTTGTGSLLGPVGWVALLAVLAVTGGLARVRRR